MEFINHKIEWNHEKISRYWDTISQNAALSQQYFGLLFGKHVAAIVNREIGFRNTSRILDLSCGRGDLLNYCLKYFKAKHHFTGTDFSKENIQAVKERFRAIPQFDGADLLTEYPSQLKSQSYDLVMSTEVVEHLNDTDFNSMLSEMSRLLSKDGYLFITTRNNEDLEFESIQCPDCGGVFHRWQHVRSWTVKSLPAAIESYGFKTIKVKTDKFASSYKFRLAFLIAQKLKLIPSTALVYIGQKV